MAKKSFKLSWKFYSIFGKGRKKGEKLKTIHYQLAASLQKIVENTIINMIHWTTTNTINIIQNLQPINDTDFTEHLENLTIDYINRGALGYAQYALEYPLKDKIICVDYARRKVKFKDKNNNVITDPEMSQLGTQFFQSIKDKNTKLINEQGMKLKEKFGDEFTKIAELLEVENAVSKAANGEKGDFHQEFVKNVCSKIVI